MLKDNESISQTCSYFINIILCLDFGPRADTRNPGLSLARIFIERKEDKWLPKPNVKKSVSVETNTDRERDGQRYVKKSIIDR